MHIFLINEWIEEGKDSKCIKIKIEFGIDSNDLHKVFQN